jgi:Tol biopolymer transport system component
VRSFIVFAFLVLCFAGLDEPALVGEGVISTPDDESGFTMTPDGKTAFFTKTSAVTTGDPMQVICVVYSDGKGHWAKPEIAPFSSAKYRDMGPALKPDGSRLYFISDRPTGNEEKQDLDIWYVDRVGSGWGEPHVLGAPVNSPANEYGVSVAANGTLYFASSRKGGKGSFDLYRSKLEDGEYKTVENLGEAVNTKGPELQPAISPDESMLVFTAYGRDDEMIGIHKTYAHGDLYVSLQKNGVFGEARNCGAPVNSGGGESWPGFSSDGSQFFFTSDRGFATYRMTRRMSLRELERGIRSTLNGMGNVWQVSADILRAAPKRAN